jgi:uncharacterized protein VirK/YbjX
MRLSRERAASQASKVACSIARMVLYPLSHVRVRKLLRVPVIAQAANLHPRMRYKHLTDNYLVRGMSIADRVRCYVHHYSRMVSSLEHDFVRDLLLGSQTIWSLNVKGHQLSISLGLTPDKDKEGEHSLKLWYDGTQVYVLSFTIVPENIVDRHAREAALICRLQGRRGAAGLLAAASKSLADVPIPIVLVSALSGICTALGIHTLACVCAEHQSSYSPDYDAGYRKAYDGLMNSMEIQRNKRGYFVSLIPLAHKPMSEIKPGHKIRTKRKRLIRTQIEADCADFISARLIASP